MDTREKAKKLIEARIKNLLNEFDFAERKEKFQNKCPCYLENKPCHEIPEDKLNCFLCYCPEYNTENKKFSVSQTPRTQGVRDTRIEIGGCNLGNPQGKGKWFHHEALPEGRIWDCSDCSYPHDKKVAEEYFKKIFNVEK